MFEGSGIPNQGDVAIGVIGADLNETGAAAGASSWAPGYIPLSIGDPLDHIEPGKEQSTGRKRRCEHGEPGRYARVRGGRCRR